ncbi:MAG: poly-gamma-glutamate biosynthesis protein PgsC/CapC [Polyangiaceae bacterium]|nr:poly-gamma-glutamate biosynthesis protein PgsC/CapC [Polyangiaceae bacterium]
MSAVLTTGLLELGTAALAPFDLGGFVIQALPSNGLDRSLHAPVLIGLVFLTFFKETYGWTYAGIVVPGYLATVFVVAPITGILVCVESVVAYLLAALAGRWIPTTGAWSSFFGRERFLLIIICAVLVRLAMEASFIPRLVDAMELPHSRELYSIGLVLIPLVANSFWNAGLISALPRVAISTALTGATVVFVLMPFTNFTVSRFQVANESVSLLFLETPHAYVILILGSIIAARDNVNYGWDYNGILVPALLAVACYQPTKLVTTVIEALIVLWLSEFITKHGPLSRVLMVGSRRMLLAYSVGFVVKWVLGQIALVVAPDVEMIDYFGFGYLLPTLLAVKMWNSDRIGATLMPTIQVAVTAFLAGNILAFGLRTIFPQQTSTEWRSNPSTATHEVSLELMLGDSAPAPTPVRAAWGKVTPGQQALAILEELVGAEEPKTQLAAEWSPGIALTRRDSGWWTLVPRSTDPDADEIAPRIAFRLPVGRTAPWLVVVDADRVAAPAIVVATEVAERTRARAVVVRSRLSSVKSHDDAFLAAAAPLLGVAHILQLTSGGTTPSLELSGNLPAGLDLAWVSELLGHEVSLSWRASANTDSPLAEALVLRVPDGMSTAAAAKIWGTPPLDDWEGSLAGALGERIEALTTVAPGAFRRPTVEELRVYGKGLLPLVLEGREPTPWARALALHLGFSFARVDDDAGWVLYEPPSAERRGAATVAVQAAARAKARASGGRVLIEIAAPRWESGVVDAGFALARAVRADGLLIHGALPTAGPNRVADVRHANGAQSYFQLAHEIWLQGGNHTAVVYGIAPGRQVSADVVVAFDRPLPSATVGPDWSRRVIDPLVASGLTVKAVDRSLELEPFMAATDPTMGYSRRFAPDQSLVVWLTERTREELLAGLDDRIASERLERLGRTFATASVAGRALELARCLPQAVRPAADCPRLPSTCQSSLLVDGLVAHAENNNPFALRAALAGPHGCHVETLRDVVSERAWVLVAGGDRVELVPLRHGAIAAPTRTVTSRPEVEAAMALALRRIRVGVAP